MHCAVTASMPASDSAGAGDDVATWCESLLRFIECSFVGPTRCGSASIAARFDQEKHLAAASCHASHRHARCSRGSSVTGTVAGPRARTRARCSVSCPAGSGGAIAGRSRRRWRFASRRRRRTRSRRCRFPPQFARRCLGERFTGSWLPVTDCQKPGKSARSRSSTRSSGVCTRTSVETGILECKSADGLPMARYGAPLQATNTQNGLCRSRQYSAASPRMSESVSSPGDAPCDRARYGAARSPCRERRANRYPRGIGERVPVVAEMLRQPEPLPSAASSSVLLPTPCRSTAR